jgi:hypothetical protein
VSVCVCGSLFEKRWFCQDRLGTEENSQGRKGGACRVFTRLSNLRKTGFFGVFPYACPEPVLEKSSFLYRKWLK